MNALTKGRVTAKVKTRLDGKLDRLSNSLWRKGGRGANILGLFTQTE